VNLRAPRSLPLMSLAVVFIRIFKCVTAHEYRPVMENEMRSPSSAGCYVSQLSGLSETNFRRNSLAEAVNLHRPRCGSSGSRLVTPAQ
jgi:hypothetical protein